MNDAFPKTLNLRVFSPSQVGEFNSKVQIYQLTEEFVYESDKYGTIIVPAGLVTDFASVPGGLKWFLDDDSPCIVYAAVVHDFLYTNSGVTSGKGFSREEADDVLREAMLKSGATKVQAWLAWKAVRTFGGKHWTT